MQPGDLQGGLGAGEQTVLGCPWRQGVGAGGPVEWSPEVIYEIFGFWTVSLALESKKKTKKMNSWK